MVAGWLEASAESGMPLDPRPWADAPISGTYPACIAVKAAGEQGREAEATYLRRLREGIVCERRRLDHPEALVALAEEAGLDRRRFEIDLGSNAILEKFGADLAEAREVSQAVIDSGEAAEDEQGRPRYPFPTVIFVAEDGTRIELTDPTYESCCEAALRLGAQPVETRPMTVDEALERFGRCATAELEALTRMARPPLMAELWAGARDWRLTPTEVLTGTLWEKA